MNYLNLGCGTRFHPAWTNIDIYSATPAVRAHDLRRGLPYADDSFQAVYSAHFFEHLDRATARRLLAECQRVLQAGGVLRLALPDLEQMARTYLAALEHARDGDASAQARHEFATALLLDQMVRTHPGGELRAQIAALETVDADYARALLGDEADAVWKAQPARAQSALGARLLRLSLGALWRKLGDALVLGASYLSGRDGAQAWREGRFRQRGEVHRWMYDGHSAARLLGELGFTDIRRCAFDDSRVAGFASYALDGCGAREHRPGSIYLEAVKP